MSKTSQLHATLTEQAASLGFRSIEEAEANGYIVDYDNEKLVKLDEEKLAHEAWLKEKNIIVSELEMLINDTPYQVYKDTYDQGYKQGHIDGVRHMRNSIVEFVEQVSETLIEATEEAITDKKGDK